MINTEKPAVIALTKQCKNIGIVNNAIPQPETWGYIKYKYTHKGERIDEQVSIEYQNTAKTLTESLFQELIEINKFDNISLYEPVLRHDLDFMQELPIDTTVAKEICAVMNTDILISIDQFLVNTIADEVPYDFGATLRYLDAKTNTRLRVYSKTGKQLTDPLLISDSIYWVATYIANKLISDDSIPSLEDAVKEATAYTAKQIAKAFAPYWTQEYRIYYGDVKEASKKVENNEWLEVIQIWQQAFDKETKTKRKARIAHNIALGYEVSDNINEALKWSQTSIELFAEALDTSIDTYNLVQANNYQQQLISRYNDFRILDLSKD
jgi:hypothetical protein